MSTLSNREYVRRYREKKAQHVRDLEAENSRLRADLAAADQDLRMLYRYVDIFEDALIRALGRSIVHTDLNLSEPPPGGYSQLVRTGSARNSTK